MRHLLSTILPWSLLLFGVATSATADVTLLPLASGFSSPVDIANAGDNSGRLFIAEQPGNIRIIQNGTLLATPFLNIQTVVESGGERGLLGLAFHPQYASNGQFFVYFTAKPAAGAGIQTGDIVIARFQRSATDANVADPASRVNILTIPHSKGGQSFANHNGGSLRFGPDGFLYAGVGDGGSGGDPFGSGQDRSVLLGKIVRINVTNVPTYTIPASNPFIGIVNVRPEIWAYGVRNPWRISFDRQTGDFYVADVGQDQHEEVNRQLASFVGGANYGWRIFEGLSCYNSPASPPNCTTPPTDYVPPIFDYPHSLGVSITGGYVYRGSSTPDLAGKYIFGDFSFSKLWFSPGDLGASFTQLTNLSQQVSTFGEGENGELYLANYSTGTILGFSSSTDTTPDAFAFFAARGVAANSVVVSNTVKVTGISANAAISVANGEYSIGCTATFTTVAATIANNATVCVRHTSATLGNADVTTTLNVGGVAANFTSSLASLALLGVQSRKTHGIAGTFDLPIIALVAPNITVEPRIIDTGHRIVFQFDGPITVPGSASVAPIGSATVSASGSEVTVLLTAIPDNQRLTVSLSGVNGSATSVQAAIGFSVGDANNTQSVNSSDISGVKARSGQATTAANFKFDVNISGAINSSDISAVKARSGLTLP